MPATGIDAAIRELQHEQKRIQGVISALKSLRPGSRLESAQGAANALEGRSRRLAAGGSL